MERVSGLLLGKRATYSISSGDHTRLVDSCSLLYFEVNRWKGKYHLIVFSLCFAIASVWKPPGSYVSICLFLYLKGLHERPHSIRFSSICLTCCLASGGKRIGCFSMTHTPECCIPRPHKSQNSIHVHRYLSSDQQLNHLFSSFFLNYCKSS